MERFGSLLTILFVIWMAWVIIRIRMGLRYQRKPDDFWEADREANNVRRKEIDPSLFFTPDLSRLPEVDPENKKAAKATEFASKNMIHFKTPISNIELKMSYGPGQLENIAQYEENYQFFIRLLLDWAEDLIKKNQKSDALLILAYTIEMHSEYRKSYMLAADLYAEANEKEKLNELLTEVENNKFKDVNMQNSIINYILTVSQA